MLVKTKIRPQINIEEIRICFTVALLASEEMATPDKYDIDGEMGFVVIQMNNCN